MSDVSIRVFHKSGAQVMLPPGKSQQEYAAMYSSIDASISAIVAAGFVASEPEKMPGEQTSTFGFVVRKEKPNNDGTVTPRVDLYINHEKMIRPYLSKYLNKPEDIAAFESASGLKLDSIRLYAGDDTIDRSTPKGSQYVKQCPRPFEVVWRENPNYDKDEAEAARKAGTVYKVSARLFIRWGNPVSESSAPTSNGQPQQRTGGIDFNKLNRDMQNAGVDYIAYRVDVEDAGDEQSLINAWKAVTVPAIWNQLTASQKQEIQAIKDRVKQSLNDPIPF